jgi:general secretion pathway protein G
MRTPDAIMFFGCLAAIVGVVAYAECRRARLRRCLASGICIHCGYNLTGNVSGRCPECGADATREMQELLAARWQRKLGRATLTMLTVLIVFLGPPFLWITQPRCGAGPPARVAIAMSAIGHNGPLRAALGRFKWDTGRWPTAHEGLNALFAAPPGTEDNWHGPYLETLPSELKDPWGEPFQYRCPAWLSTDGFDLWSKGPNRLDDRGQPGSDDVGNWPAR